MPRRSTSDADALAAHPLVARFAADPSRYLDAGTHEHELRVLLGYLPAYDNDADRAQWFAWSVHGRVAFFAGSYHRRVAGTWYPVTAEAVWADMTAQVNADAADLDDAVHVLADAAAWSADEHAAVRKLFDARRASYDRYRKALGTQRATVRMAKAYLTPGASAPSPRVPVDAPSSSPVFSLTPSEFVASALRVAPGECVPIADVRAEYARRCGLGGAPGRQDGMARELGHAVKALPGVAAGRKWIDGRAVAVYRGVVLVE